MQECRGYCIPDTPTIAGAWVCQTCAQANASAPFWNQATSECVAKCPELTVNGHCKPCSDVDAGKPFWNGEVCQSCPDERYWDQIQHACVETCLTGIADEEKRLCVQCGEGEFWNGTACTACPAWLPNWHRELRTCVAKCKEDAPYFNGTSCVTCKEYSYQNGLYLPYWTGSECSDTCPESAPLKKYNYCSTCEGSNKEKPFWDGFQCLSCSAELGGEYLDGHKCVSECPESYRTSGSGKICATCLEKSNSTPFWNGSECVACPEGQYFANSKCAESCPSGLAQPISGQICVKTCGQYQELSGTQCVCAGGLELKRGRYDHCAPPGSKYWEDYVSTCTANAQVMTLNT